MVLLAHALFESELVSIKDCRVERAICPGCRGDVIVKRGHEREWHFAHKSTGACSSESALHLYAKELIVSGWEQARRDGTDYFLGWTYPSCRHPGDIDLSTFVEKIHVEKKLSIGAVPDLFCEVRGGRNFAIEVVVTHEIEEETKDRYLKNRIPVFCVYPNWCTIQRLRDGIYAGKSLGVDPTKCSTCSNPPPSIPKLNMILPGGIEFKGDGSSQRFTRNLSGTTISIEFSVDAEHLLKPYIETYAVLFKQMEERIIEKKFYFEGQWVKPPGLDNLKHVEIDAWCDPCSPEVWIQNVTIKQPANPEKCFSVQSLRLLFHEESFRIWDSKIQWFRQDFEEPLFGFEDSYFYFRDSDETALEGRRKNLLSVVN